MVLIKTLKNLILPASFTEAIGTKPVTDEIATSNDGRDITRGFIPPDLILNLTDSILTGRGGYDFDIYKELARDDQVKTCRQQRELALIGKEWIVEPGDSSRKAKYAADRLSAVLKNISFDDKSQKMLSALIYGYAVSEILWATDGSEITIESIKVRDRARFGWLPNGELRLKTSKEMTRGEALPPAKFWAFSCGADHDDDPYGLGLGHYLYWPVFFKKNGIKFWLYFLEKFGQPTALGKYPVNASDDEKKKLLKALMAIQSDSAIRIPEGMTVELLEAARSGSADYCSLIDRMNAAISKVMLGHSAAADSTAGKLGGEDNAGDMREDLIKADADLICNSFNQTAAKWLTQYNDPTAPLPRVWRKCEPDEDLKLRADTDKLIFDMGYKPTLDYVHTKYGGEYEAVSSPVASDAATTQAVDNQNQPAQFAENSLQTPLPSEQMVSLLGQTAQPVMDSYLAAIKGLLDSCDSLQEFQQRLPALFPEMDNATLSNLLANAFMAADLAGRSDVNAGQ